MTPARRRAGRLLAGLVCLAAAALTARAAETDHSLLSRLAEALEIDARELLEARDVVADELRVRIVHLRRERPDAR